MSDAEASRLAELFSDLEQLGLGEIRRRAWELIDRAKTEQWTPAEFLRQVLRVEVEFRDAEQRRMRLELAGFPQLKTLESFDFARSGLRPELYEYLTSFRWVDERENILLIGSAGTGKTHLATALGYAALERGHGVRFFTTIDLVETLYRSLADNSVGRVIDDLLQANIVILDEMGIYPMDEFGAQLLFRFVAAAYERKSLIVASHWPFEQWGRFLPERATTVSLLDRLLHHSVVAVTSGESFRLQEAKLRDRPWRSGVSSVDSAPT